MGKRPASYADVEALPDNVVGELEVLRLEGAGYTPAGLYTGSLRIRAEPFESLEWDLGALWLDRKRNAAP